MSEAQHAQLHRRPTCPSPRPMRTPCRWTCNGTPRRKIRWPPRVPVAQRQLQLTDGRQAGQARLRRLRHLRGLFRRPRGVLSQCGGPGLRSAPVAVPSHHYHHLSPGPRRWPSTRGDRPQNLKKSMCTSRIECTPPTTCSRLEILQRQAPTAIAASTVPRCRRRSPCGPPPDRRQPPPCSTPSGSQCVGWPPSSCRI